MLPEISAAVMLVALTAYALFGGADFGGGVWDLLARGDRADRQRETIAHAIGPIWEANHVWLIVVVVVLFTAFPPAFSLIMTRLHVPVTLMLIGIVMRGSSFVFRTYDTGRTEAQRRWGRIFAISSLVTPVLLGVVLGTVTTTHLAAPPDDAFDAFIRPWLHPFAWAVGLFALAQFAFLAATYLTVDADDEPLREDFRARALGAAVAVGVLALTVGLLAGEAAPHVREGLLGRGWSWPLQIATAIAATGAIAALWRRRYLAARVLAAAQVALILLGWGLSMNPWLVPGALTIRDAAAPEVTLRLMLLILGGGSVILLPAFYYLFRTFKGGVIFGRMAERPGEKAS